MGVIASILVGFFSLACLLKPAWGFLGYVATLIIRPNELLAEGEVPVPTGPVMIVAAGLGVVIALLTQRSLPRPEGPRPRSVVLMVVLTLLLFFHLVAWRQHELRDWILNDGGQVILLLIFMTRLMSTPERLSAHFTTITASASLVAAVPFFVHFFFKQKEHLVKNPLGGWDPSCGPVWDLYHLYNYDMSTAEPKLVARLMGKAKSMWGNSNDLGMVTNWAIAGVLYRLRRRGSKFIKLLLLGLAGMLSTVLVLTRSRAGLLQLGVTLWLTIVGGKRRVLGIILLLVTVASILVVLPMLKRADADDSERERLSLLMSGVGMIKANPILGVGFNAFQDRSFRKLLAHNVYMQCLAETGLVGAAVFFPLIFFLRRETSQALRFFESQPNADKANLARAISALQFSFTIFIFFSNHFMRFTFAIPMTMGIGLYVAMLREKSKMAAEDKACAELKEKDDAPESAGVGVPEAVAEELSGGKPSEGGHR